MEVARKVTELWARGQGEPDTGEGEGETERIYGGRGYRDSDSLADVVPGSHMGITQGLCCSVHHPDVT